MAVHALTGLNSNGSWPPTLLAISQMMNQMSVMTTSISPMQRHSFLRGRYRAEGKTLRGSKDTDRSEPAPAFPQARFRLFDLALGRARGDEHDIDVAKVFYVDQVGFGLDHDARPEPGMRVV